MDKDIEVSYRRNLDQNQMVLESSRFFPDSYKIRMLEGNPVEGLLPVRVQRLNGGCSLCYEITSLQNLSSLFGKKGMDRESLALLLRSLFQTLQGVQMYLLDPEDILTEPDYIYMDPDYRRVRLCYVPDHGAGKTGRYRELADFILKHLDHSDYRAVNMGYQFYNEASDPEKDSAAVFSCIEQNGIDTDRPDKDTERDTDKVPAPEFYVPEKDHRRPKPIPSRKGRDQTGKKGRGKHKVTVLVLLSLTALFGAVVKACSLDLTQTGGLAFLFLAVVWLFHNLRESRSSLSYRKEEEEEEDDEEEWLDMEEENYRVSPTQLLQGAAGETGPEAPSSDSATRSLASGCTGRGWYLVSENPERYPDVRLDGKSGLIGKKKEQTDICLPAEEISRIHARLETDGKESFLTDMNSLNGTFVNGRRLEPNERTKIEENDRVDFAGMAFRIHMM